MDPATTALPHREEWRKKRSKHGPQHFYIAALTKLSIDFHFFLFLLCSFIFLFGGSQLWSAPGGSEPLLRSADWPTRARPNAIGAAGRRPIKTQSNPVKPSQTQSNPVKPSQTQSNQSKLSQTQSNPVKPSKKTGTQLNPIKPSIDKENPVKPSKDKENPIKPNET